MTLFLVLGIINQYYSKVTHWAYFPAVRDWNIRAIAPLCVFTFCHHFLVLFQSHLSLLGFVSILFWTVVQINLIWVTYSAANQHNFISEPWNWWEGSTADETDGNTFIESWPWSHRVTQHRNSPCFMSLHQNAPTNLIPFAHVWPISLWSFLIYVQMSLKSSYSFLSSDQVFYVSVQVSDQRHHHKERRRGKAVYLLGSIVVTYFYVKSTMQIYQ